MGEWTRWNNIFNSSSVSGLVPACTCVKRRWVRSGDSWRMLNVNQLFSVLMVKKAWDWGKRPPRKRQSVHGVSIGPEQLSVSPPSLLAVAQSGWQIVCVYIFICTVIFPKPVPVQTYHLRCRLASAPALAAHMVGSGELGAQRSPGCEMHQIIRQWSLAITKTKKKKKKKKKKQDYFCVSKGRVADGNTK